jgi:acetate kinase
MFALPKALADAGVQRYGFHGLSYEYIASVLPQHDPHAAAGKTIVLHLGNGASMCALESGKSVATTMGFTALDGLPMGTRCGTLDPGVILFLLDEHKMDARDRAAALPRVRPARGIGDRERHADIG